MIKKWTASKEKWDQYLKDSRFGSVFLSSSWIYCVDVDNQAEYYGIYKGDQVVGGFIIFQRKGRVLNDIFLPNFTPHLGIWIDQSQSTTAKEREVVEQYSSFLAACNVDQLSIAFRHDFNDLIPFKRQGFELGLGFTYQVSLSLPTDELFKNILVDKRRNIKKAQKKGLTISFNYDEKIIHLVHKSLKRQGKSAIQIDRIERLISRAHESEIAFQVNCYLEDCLISSLFMVYDQKYAYYLMGGYEDETPYEAGPFTMWNAILKAKELGLEVFDFEGSQIPSIEKYFQRFGPTLEKYGIVSSSSKKARMVNRILK